MTYSGDPSGSDADAVRFHLGDTTDDAATEIFSDAEVSFALGQYSNDTVLAAAYLATARAMRLADKRDRAVGPLVLKYGEQFARWNEMAERLTKLSKGRGRLGGIKLGAAELMGGGPKYLGTDDSPLTYNEGEGTVIDD